MPSIKTIICTKCGTSKLLEDFANRPQRRGGREAQCKKCNADRVRANNKANPEKDKASYDAMNRANKAKSDQW